MELQRDGETYPPGGTFKCRWWGAGYNPSRNAPQSVSMALWKDCLDYAIPYNEPRVDSGNPRREGSYFTARLMDGIEEGRYCLKLTLGLEEGSVYGFSKLFDIGQPTA